MQIEAAEQKVESMAEETQAYAQWMGLPKGMMEMGYAMAKQTLEALTKQALDRFKDNYWDYAERVGVYQRALSELGAMMLAGQARFRRIGFDRFSQFMGACVFPLMDQAVKDEEEEVQKLVDEIMRRVESGGKPIG